MAKSIAKKLLYQSFFVKEISNDIKKSLWSYKDLFEEFPYEMLNILDKMGQDNFNVEFEIKDINIIQRRFERTFNRMSFSVILLAVSIIILEL